ncbi:MAG TPA: transposase, partial [Novosphingobium sp.]|nr:transposase [Novosphingobium sp.]
GDLSEAEWRALRGLLPIDAANRGRGRRPEHNRSVINGILWRLRCGTACRDVPPKYGNWNTIYRCWSEASVWEAVSVTLAEIMADTCHYSIDSTTLRAQGLVRGQRVRHQCHPRRRCSPRDSGRHSGQIQSAGENRPRPGAAPPAQWH